VEEGEGHLWGGERPSIWEKVERKTHLGVRGVHGGEELKQRLFDPNHTKKALCGKREAHEREGELEMTGY